MPLTWNASRHEGSTVVASERTTRPAWWAVALASLAVLAVVDAAIPADTAVLTVFFVIAPLIACAVLPPADTAVVAALSVAVAVASAWWDDGVGTAQQTVRTIDVVIISVAAVVVAVVRQHRERRYSELSRIAEAAQRAILPILPRVASGVGITAHYQSAAVGALVGGDLYDCYHHQDLSRIIIGDVRGKGIAGVEQAARVIRAFRQAAARAETLVQVVEDMDRYLAGFFDEEEFVTALLVEVAADPDHAILVDAGHPPPLLVGDSTGLRALEVREGMPMGTGLPARWEATPFTWQARDRLLLYTDGLSEARDENGEFLPLARLAGPLREAPAERAIQRVLDTVAAHAAHARLGDDLALVLLENSPPGTTRG